MEKNEKYITSARDISKVAVLFQSHHPPEIDHIRKPMKPTGYRDSSADIAVALKELDVDVVTPVDNPDILVDDDWCFADSYDGIKKAFDQGARVFWLNTILYKGHPITEFFGEDIGIIGQSPNCVHNFDDKYLTNNLLIRNNLPVPKEILLSTTAINSGDQGLLISEVTAEVLEKEGFSFPIVIKPLRGRGSQGVMKIENIECLKMDSKKLLSELITIDGKQYFKYGNRLILEEFLDGEEITISIMTPGKYFIDKNAIEKENYWALPIVKRYGHHGGIAPYNGVVAVAENSTLLKMELLEDKRYIDIVQSCEKAAELISAEAPIRIDCRFKRDKAFILDVNLKPNMTGAIRPHRSNQNGLTAIAAKGINWDYKNLILNILNQAWVPKKSETK